ncbi:hypothetical protein NOK75_00755 [Vibrio parahaemolyticus]|uniref:hypothetical protein n=1 Tax=Vibrio TaxID=662 RepID=UPI0005067497|nr:MULTISPECIES: hypothetical protein [Vibrio]KFK53452.1 hypothetical protein JS86_19775 [Vibrio vulnificus]MCX8840436.1 hypothetical protein [Vibrio parahaemolyticus]
MDVLKKIREIEVKYKVPNWPSLRLLGQSNAVKMTMLIPFLGYLILFNDKVISFINTAFEAVGLSGGGLSSEANLYFIYFGLTILGVATLLFQVFCPALIKEYSSVRVYVESNVEYMTSHRLRSLCTHMERLSGKSHVVIDNAKKSLAISESSSKNVLREPYVDVLQHFWNVSAWDKTPARIGIVTLYGIGFILLTIPSVKMFARVLVSAF